ncbi:cyclic nucleotide-binding domain-containing protein [Haliovirga abyssi]|uniref:Cyclic nucleotide-binding domain-containing protein n=1 Tax=Haliovirga abyssi TaxID=2996794 RepID=A0AAU9D981_9FUSO|nr:cyclic nucleotide-binding domain-containing protein [Haliovirga abyssi]BDU49840.1 hypothetical protein HLVA_04090 [Haliovirga abyssi]
MRTFRINKGGIIYFENTVDNNVYVIRKGKVEIIRTNTLFLVDNNLKNRKRLKEGDVFGFEEVFFNLTRGERAIALENTELIVFPITDFSAFMEKNITIGEKMINSLAGKIRKLNNKIKEISNRTECIMEHGKIKDIYIYFLKQGEYKKAQQILERMIVKESDVEFAIKEKDRISILQSLGISVEKIDAIVSKYKDNEELNILLAILEGMKIKVVAEELHEKIFFEMIKIKKKIGKDDEYLNRLKEFLEEFPYSDYIKDVMFDLIEEYDKRKRFPEALSIANKLTDEELTNEEIEKTKKNIEKLKHDIPKEGEENVG